MGPRATRSKLQATATVSTVNQAQALSPATPTLIPTPHTRNPLVEVRNEQDLPIDEVTLVTAQAATTTRSATKRVNGSNEAMNTAKTPIFREERPEEYLEMTSEGDDEIDEGEGMADDEEEGGNATLDDDEQMLGIEEDEVEEDEDEDENRKDEDEDEDEGDDDDDDDDDDEDDEFDEDELYGRSDGEADALRYEMHQVETMVPDLKGRYRLVDRLGEGTFSSVYKAIDLRHDDYDNTHWAPSAKHGRPSSEGSGGKIYVAIKRIYVTSSPDRIRNELDILNVLRGKDNIAYLIEAMRHDDQVIAIMPYSRHQDFRTYYRTATLPLLRSYFACLFRALASTHVHHIIHRDVKPANFLFDITQGTGQLCDYGLAQSVGGDAWIDWKAQCLHSLPGQSWGGLEGRRATREKMAREPGRIPGLLSGLHGVKMQRPVSLCEQVADAQREFQALGSALEEKKSKSGLSEQELIKEEEELFAKQPWWVPNGYHKELRKKEREESSYYKNWRATTQTQHTPKDRIGFLKEDRRPGVRANRAGTRGFRAPEVLIKCPDQTVSLDIWSAGIILLCFLTRRFPFFNSNDDVEALAEIGTIFGKRRMERCSALHNRTFVSNIPDFENPAHDNLHALVKSLNPPIFVENSPNPYGPIPSDDKDDQTWYPQSPLFHAVDLMKRCLELDCTKRWTAEECLEHPFFFSGKFDAGMGRLVDRDERFW